MSTLCDPTDRSLPRSSVHGILQARTPSPQMGWSQTERGERPSTPGGGSRSGAVGASPCPGTAFRRLGEEGRPRPLGPCELRLSSTACLTSAQVLLPASSEGRWRVRSPQRCRIPPGSASGLPCPAPGSGLWKHPWSGPPDVPEPPSPTALRLPDSLLSHPFVHFLDFHSDVVSCFLSKAYFAWKNAFSALRP